MATDEHETEPLSASKGPAVLALLISVAALGFAIAAFVRSGRTDAIAASPISAPVVSKDAAATPEEEPAEPTAPVEGPQIVINRMVHDFGMMRPRTSKTTSFTIRNTGTQTLSLQPPKTSCGCTVANLTTRTIHPGKQSKLDIRFDAGGGNAKRPLTKTVTVRSNDPKQPVITLKIKATVQPIYVIEPPYIHFGTVLRGTEQRRVVTVRSTDNKPITLKSVSIDKPEFTLENAKLGVAALRHNFTIRVKPDLPARFVRGALKVTTDRDSGPPPVSTVNLQVRGRVQLQPTAHTWRVSQVGRTYDRMQTLIGSEDEPLEIKSVKTSGGPFKAELIEVQKGKRYQVKITLDLAASEAKKAFNEKLVVETNYEDERVLEIPLNVRVFPQRPVPPARNRATAPPRPGSGTQKAPPQKP